jgi:hypothetical protein
LTVSSFRVGEVAVSFTVESAFAVSASLLLLHAAKKMVAAISIGTIGFMV